MQMMAYPAVCFVGFPPSKQLPNTHLWAQRARMEPTTLSCCQGQLQHPLPRHSSDQPHSQPRPAPPPSATPWVPSTSGSSVASGL